jgi:RNA polymerase sigma factor (sigma-70 family)
MKSEEKAARSRRKCMVAMVLGTALSALGASAPVVARPEVPPQTITNLSRYCTACWRNARIPADYWSDCTQEVFRRLLERLAPATWDQALGSDGQERQELLRAIDAVKKRTQRGLKLAPRPTLLVADHRARQERQRAEEREAIAHWARQLLTPRQQRIVQLSLEGWSVQDIARALHLRPERVSDEKYKAIRKLRAHFLQEDDSEAIRDSLS